MARLRSARVAVLLGLTVAGPAAAQGRVAEVVANEGTVHVLRGERIERIEVGSPVFQADEVFCGIDSRVQLRFADGSVVAIGPASRIRVADFSTGQDGGRLSAVLSMVRGVMRAVVSQQPGAGRFEVETDTAVASVRSTDWFVDAAPGVASVFVHQGTVSVVPKYVRAEILLHDGEGIDLVARSDHRPGEPVRWGAARVQGLIDRITVR